MPAHEHLRLGGAHPLEGGCAAIAAIRHDEVASRKPKMLEPLALMLIADDHLIQSLLAQIIAAMQARGTPAVRFHPHHRGINHADA